MFDEVQFKKLQDIACTLIRTKRYPYWEDVREQVMFVFNIPGQWRTIIDFTNPSAPSQYVFVPNMYASYKQSFFIQALINESKNIPFTEWLNLFN